VSRDSALYLFIKHGDLYFVGFPYTFRNSQFSPHSIYVCRMILAVDSD
jgi:hypothetical protein